MAALGSGRAKHESVEGIVYDRLSHAFRIVMCRKPTEFDLKVLRRAYEKQAAIFAKDVTGAKSLLAVGVVEAGRDH